MDFVVDVDYTNKTIKEKYPKLTYKSGNKYKFTMKSEEECSEECEYGYSLGIKDGEKEYNFYNSSVRRYISKFI